MNAHLQNFYIFLDQFLLQILLPMLIALCIKGEWKQTSYLLLGFYGGPNNQISEWTTSDFQPNFVLLLEYND